MGDEQQVPLQHWFSELDPREQAQIKHALAYAEDHAGAGAPGHGQFMLIAKLARLLDEREHAITSAQGRLVVQKVVRDGDSWRDVYTGVRVEL